MGPELSVQIKLMKKVSKNSGFMMVETLVAASIIAVSVLVSMTVAQKSVYISRQALHTAQAAFLLEEGAEMVRILRDNSWNNISNLTAGTTYYPTFSGSAWTLSTTGSTVGIFTRSLTISSVNRDDTTKDIVNSSGTPDSGTKLFTVTVSWGEGGTTITKTLKFYIANIFS